MTDFKSELRKILLSMNLGYQYQMSDYATSKESEQEYEKKGLAEVDATVDAILELFNKQQSEIHVALTVGKYQKYI
ncbi:MAG: hypothetical protein WCJ60_02295 [bacterium]